MGFKEVIASDLYGTLVKHRSLGIMHPNVYKLIKNLNKDIIILSSETPQASEIICTNLKIKIVGAYGFGDVREEEEFFKGSIRVFEETKKYIERHFIPTAYITSQNMDTVLAAHFFGKSLYCGEIDIIDQTSIFSSLLGIPSDKLLDKIYKFNWDELDSYKIKGLIDFLR